MKRPSRLALGLYPFATAAVAINLFLFGLALHYITGLILPPAAVLWLSPVLGVPATWLAARWVRHLIAEAEGTNRNG